MVVLCAAVFGLNKEAPWGERKQQVCVFEHSDVPQPAWASRAERAFVLMPEGDDKDQMQVAESAGESIVACQLSLRRVEPRWLDKNSALDPWILRSLALSPCCPGETLLLAREGRRGYQEVVPPERSFPLLYCGDRRHWVRPLLSFVAVTQFFSVSRAQQNNL